MAKLSGVSSTTSGRPTAAPPIARAGRVASPAAAASPARRLTATSPSPSATSAFAWARAVTAGREHRVAETRDLLPRVTPHVATGANVDAATMLILDGRAVHACLYQWPAPTLLRRGTQASECG